MFVVLLLSMAVLMLSGRFPYTWLLNTDSLAVPALVASIGELGLPALRSWYWPPAPYLATDFLVYGPISAIAPTPLIGAVVFALVQLTLLYWAIRFCTASLAAEHSGARTWGPLLSVLLICAMALRGIDPVSTVLLSYYRTGGFIVALLALGIVMRGWSKTVARGRTGMVVSALAAGAVVASDPLMLPAVVGPILALWSVSVWLAKGRIPWRSGAIIGGIAATGLLVSRMMETEAFDYSAGVSLADPYRQLRSVGGVVLRTDPLLLGIGVAVFLALLWMRWGRASEAAGATLAFWVLSSVGVAAASIVSAQAAVPRYFLFSYLLPLSVAGPLLLTLVEAALPRERFGLISVGSTLSVLPLVGLAIVNVGSVRAEWETPFLNCVEDVVEAGDYDRGISGYWTSKQVALLTDPRPAMAIFDQEGRAMKINAPSSWFEGVPQFGVADGHNQLHSPSLAVLMSMAEEPTITDCGGLAVVTSSDGKLDPQRMAEPGEEVLWEGCWLLTMVGQPVEDGCDILVPQHDGPAFAAYGGYIRLPPGSYRSEVVLSQIGGSGTVESRAVHPDGSVLVLAETDYGSVDAAAQLEFTVPPGGWLSEVRVISNGQPHRLDFIRVTRLPD